MRLNMQELFSLSLAVWELPSAAQKKRTFLTFVLQAGKLTSQRRQLARALQSQRVAQSCAAGREGVAFLC
jgi:hypothetical protein